MSGFLDDQLESAHYFDGAWRPATTSWYSTAPATGRSIGLVGGVDADQVREICAQARAAQRNWSAAAPDEKSAVLKRAAEAARTHFEDIVVLLMEESGSVRAKAEFELSLTIKALELSAGAPFQAQGVILPGEAGRLNLARRRPLGVVGVISPFNFPLYLAMRAVAPALAMGNAVIVKPDPRTALCGGHVIARIMELAGLPAGLLSILPGGGDIGASLCADPDVAMIQFTGSTDAGRKVGELAGRHLKKVSLELGGKNSLIVLDDADLDLAASAAAWAIYLHQGQICMSAGRILVHADIVKSFTEKLAEKARSLPVGDPMSEQVALGPMIDQGQCDRAMDIVKHTCESGADLIVGGECDGLAFKPTVLTGVKPGMPAYDFEIFAPVAVIVPFEDDDEAVSMANNTEYGLSAGIISADVSRAMRIGDQLRTGILHINDQTVNDEVTNPFGGTGASGNGTSIGGPANWEEFTQWQWMTIRGAPPAYPF